MVRIYSYNRRVYIYNTLYYAILIMQRNQTDYSYYVYYVIVIEQ